MRLVCAAGMEQQADAHIIAINWHGAEQLEELAVFWLYLMCLKFPC